MNLSHGFTFQDLHTSQGLKRLDEVFLSFLGQVNQDLCSRVKVARMDSITGLAESVLLLDLAPYVEDFIGELFNIKKDITSLQAEIHALAPLYRFKRQFVQREAAKTYSVEEAQKFNGDDLKLDLERLMGEPYSDLVFARYILNALDRDMLTSPLLEVGKKYAAWAMHQDKPSVPFRLPKKINPDSIKPLEKEGISITSTKSKLRRGFDCTDTGLTLEEAQGQAHYCILCHPQQKDSCSKGLNEKAQGCPLDQKISEMNVLRTQGNLVGALGVIMVDNPLVAGTGHRICNDCSKACIFQKQDPVDVPGAESQTLEAVLNLPWGVEIYSLLSRWNPLNIKNPYPKDESGFAVLVAGMGPAGFTLAHYLLNEGHRVVGIDGLKIEPLSQELLDNPIRNWSDLKGPLSKRLPQGFGGVVEYGITVRWDKNYLTLIRLLLERRASFFLFDGVRIGSTLSLPQAFELGFDHVALCLGAGRPKVLDLHQGQARGVRLASDFLMSLQLTGAAQIDSSANLQVRLPICIVGGGLTAVDTATEALAYYSLQVEKFLRKYERVGKLPSSLTEEEKQIAEEFLAHAKALRIGDRKFLEKASTLLYRKALKESPAYRLNPFEVEQALEEGVRLLEKTEINKVNLDRYGHIESIEIDSAEGSHTLPCRTLLIAAGTQPNTILEAEDPDVKFEGEDVLLSYKGQQRISYFGDLHERYNGSVVKAMASAKIGYKEITESLQRENPKGLIKSVQKLNRLFRPVVERVNRLTPTILEIVIQAPQAAKNFQPGQFYRLQNYGPNAMEGIALTGAHVDQEKGLLSLIVLEVGESSRLCQHLKPGQRVVLMGPTGSPTVIPQNETILLIGGGLGNAVLFSIGKALKEKGNRVVYVAGYKASQDRFKVNEIEEISDHIVWCCEEEEIVPGRSQDFSYKGTIVDGLYAYATQSPPIPLNQVDRILTIGSDRMMAAIACARKTVLKPFLNSTHAAVGSINSPMQCMMKEICGQCIQTLTDPLTGSKRVIFTCAAQDQSLDEVDFENLQARLAQNSLLEKQANQRAEVYE